MSEMEHRLLCEGIFIHNHTDYRKYRKGKSTAVGFSFGNGGLDDAIYDSRRLKGVVVMDWLLVAEADRNMFTDCMGCYPSIYSDNGDAIELDWFDELCLQRYALQDFRRSLFYKVKGIDLRQRRAFVSGMATTKERNTLNVANKVARDIYANLTKGMDSDDLFQWIMDNQPAHSRIADEICKRYPYPLDEPGVPKVEVKFINI